MSANFQLWILLAVIVLFAVAITLARLFAGVRPGYQYRKREFLMSPTERSCYDALLTGLGSEYHVFPQIHLDCILEPTAYGRDKIYAFRHINQKSVDFVLCDKQFRSVLAIELDDRSHERPDRVRRDELVSGILKDAGIPLLRIKNRGVFDSQELAAQARSAIAPPTPTQAITG